MAVVSVPRENRRFEAGDEIREFLAPYGIRYEQWGLTARVDPSASSDEILAAYAPKSNA